MSKTPSYKVNPYEILINVEKFKEVTFPLTLFDMMEIHLKLFLVTLKPKT